MLEMKVQVMTEKDVLGAVVLLSASRSFSFIKFLLLMSRCACRGLLHSYKGEKQLNVTGTRSSSMVTQ